jgi:hypothetical protein
MPVAPTTNAVPLRIVNSFCRQNFRNGQWKCALCPMKSSLVAKNHCYNWKNRKSLLR